MARPALDEARLQEQRDRLIAASLVLYRAEGYEAVTLRNLAAQLDISHATPYRYFKSKDELVAAVRTEVYTRFAEYLEQWDDLSLPPLRRLRRICLGVVDFGRRFPEDYRLIFSLRQAPVSDYPALQHVRERALAYVIEICREAIAAGQLVGDATTWAHVAWSAMHGLLSLHVANLLVVGRDLDSLVEPLLHALLPGSEAAEAMPSAKLAVVAPSTSVPNPS